MPPVTDTAYRMALTALLVEAHAQHLPTPLREAIQGTLRGEEVWPGPESLRQAIERWLTTQGPRIGRGLRQVLGMTDATLPGTGEQLPRESASTEWRRKMASVHAHDPKDKPETPEPTTVALFGGDKMTQLSSVYDQMHCAPYDMHPDGLEKAYEACLEDRVRPTDDPEAVEVQSKQPAEGWYQVRGAYCTCPYSNMHPKEAYGCYHTIAARLYQRWQQALAPLLPSPAQKETPVVETVPNGVVVTPATVPSSPQVLIHSGAVMHEAPYSMNVTVVSPQGYEMQLTVRKTDFAEFGRSVLGLEAWCLKHDLLPRKRLQNAPGQAQPVGTTQEPSEAVNVPTAPPVCLYHGPMKESTKAPGTYYCSKKLADGTYCRERFPKAA